MFLRRFDFKRFKEMSAYFLAGLCVIALFALGFPSAIFAEEASCEQAEESGAVDIGEEQGEEKLDVGIPDTTEEQEDDGDSATSGQQENPQDEDSEDSLTGDLSDPDQDIQEEDVADPSLTEEISVETIDEESEENPEEEASSEIEIEDQETETGEAIEEEQEEEAEEKEIHREARVNISFATDENGYVDVGEVVSFTLAIDGIEPALYVWSFGDGGSSDIENPEHIYLSDGNYEVTVEIIDIDGNKVSSGALVHASDHDPNTTEWYVSNDAVLNADDPIFYQEEVPLGNDPENPITVESVFNHLVDGDTVYFLPGTYDDTYTDDEDASINLDGIGTGTEENPINFIAYDDVIFDGKGELENAFYFSDPLSYIGFYNFIFANYTDAAIKIENQEIKDIEIVDNTFVDNKKAIDAEMKEGLKVENNIFSGNEQAIVVDSDDVSIENNVIEGSETAITVQPQSNDVVVDYNDFFDNDIEIVGIELGENNIFLDPMIEFGSDYELMMDEDSPLISNNIIKVIKTNKKDYLYTEQVIIRGNGYQPGTDLVLDIIRADGSKVDSIYIKADQSGGFSYDGYSVDYAGSDYLIEVKDTQGNIIEVLSFTDDSGLSYVDLNNWSAPPGDSGSWEVQPGGRTVFQTVNGGRVYYLSPDDYMDRTIKGTLMVRYNGEDESNGVYYDDDWIGFVFGYVDSLNYLLLEWRGGYGYSTDSGFELIKVTNGSFNTLATNYTPSYDDTYASINRYECGYNKKNENDLGWKFSNDTPTSNMTELHDNRYIFDLIYTESEIKIFIDDDEIFDVTGSFVPGQFGFYNYSQSMVEYGNVQSAPGSLVPVPPVAGNDSYGMDTDGTLEKDRYEGILSNDYDSNLDTFTIDQVTDVSHGSLVLDTDTGAFTYTPESGFEGVDVFTYRLIEDDDPTMISDTATVSISVQEPNVAPTDISLSNDEAEVSADTGDIVGSLSTTDGNENDSFDYMLIDNSSGRFGISSNRILVADSSAYNIGDTYNITVRSTDLRGLYYEKTFTITITASNSSVSPASATFDLNTSNTGQGNYADIGLTIDFDGNTLEGISCQGSGLVENTDYTVSGASVTIKKEFLETKNTGNIDLVFDFSSGNDFSVTVSVRDSASQSTPAPAAQQDDGNDPGEDGGSSSGPSPQKKTPITSYVSFDLSGSLSLKDNKAKQVTTANGNMKVEIKDLGSDDDVLINVGSAKIGNTYFNDFELLKQIPVNELGQRFEIKGFVPGSDIYKLDVVGGNGSTVNTIEGKVEVTLEFDEGLINPTLSYWDEENFEWVVIESDIIGKDKLKADFEELGDLILCVRDDIRTQVDTVIKGNTGGSVNNYLGSKKIDLNISQDTFSEDVMFKITEVTVTDYIDSLGNKEGKINIDGKIYDFKAIGVETGKHYGTQDDPFSKPLEIILECSQDAENPVIAWFDEEKGEWVEVMTVRIDPTHVKAIINHFSKWAVLEKKSLVELADLPNVSAPWFIFYGLLIIS